MVSSKVRSYFSVQNLVLISMFIALNIVFSRFLAISTPTTRIGLGNVTVILAGMMLGPIAGLIVGGLSDIIGTVLFSQFAWYPPMALSPICLGLLTGLIWKLVGTKKMSDSPNRINLIKVALPIIAVELITEFGWKTYCLYLMSLDGPAENIRAYIPLLIARLPFSFLVLAIDVFIIYLLYKVSIFRKFDGFKRSSY